MCSLCIIGCSSSPWAQVPGAWSWDGFLGDTWPWCCDERAYVLIKAPSVRGSPSSQTKTQGTRAHTHNTTHITHALWYLRCHERNTHTHSPEPSVFCPLHITSKWMVRKRGRIRVCLFSHQSDVWEIVVTRNGPMDIHHDKTNRVTLTDYSNPLPLIHIKVQSSLFNKEQLNTYSTMPITTENNF